jgi:hypothetical protein
MRNAIVLIACLLACGTAPAGGTASWSLVPYVRPNIDLGQNIDVYEAQNHAVCDLQVNVDAGDKWTTISARASIEGNPGGYLSFWDHPVGGNIPTPSLFQDFGLSTYDTFWTCTEEYPNPDLNPDAIATTFAPGSPVENTSTVRQAEWYADPGQPEAGAGLFTLARFNIVGRGPFQIWHLPGPTLMRVSIVGDMYFASTGGTPHPYSLFIDIIPEPASLGLLLIGAVAVPRRRSLATA